jgi:lipopolysaccharide cholinephosphotransferase
MLRKLQLTEFGILKKFIKICEKNNLRYYLCGGTLLGAIRHKGFIPWDDDIDVTMPREDYNRFYEIYKDKHCRVDQKFFIDEAEVDVFPYIKILDKTVKTTTKNTINTGYMHAWIDVFPMDGLPENNFFKFLHLRKYLFGKTLYQFAAFEGCVDQKRTNRPLYEKITIKLLNKFKIQRYFNDKKKYLLAVNKILSRYSMYKTSYCFRPWGIYKFKNVLPTNWFGEGVLVEFEGIMVNAPINYDGCLKQLYGDYMTLPPEDKRQGHGIEILDEDKTKQALFIQHSLS